MEPLQIRTEPEMPKAEKPEKASDSDSKKKRERTARHLRVVNSDPKVENRRESKESNLTDAENKAQEPTSLVDLFEGKVSQAKTEDSGVKAESEAIDPEAEDQKDVKAAIQALASAGREQLAQKPIELGDEEVDQFFEAIENGEGIESSAVEIQQAMGVSNEAIDALETEMPSKPPLEIDEAPNEFMQSDMFEPTEFADLITPELENQAEPSHASLSEANFENSAEDTPEADPDEASAPPVSKGGTGGPPRPPFGPDITSSANPNPDSPRPQFVTSGNINAPQSNEIYDSGNPAVTALIGYLIGRRRGRRKAERRAAKDMRQHERQVKHQIEGINWQLKAKEQQIRKLARDKAEQERNMYGVLKPIERSTGVAAQRPEAVAEKPNIERRMAPEASQLHGASKTREHLGQVLVSAAELPMAAAKADKINHELRKAASTETVKQKAAEQLPKQLTERQVETLNRQQLLSMSEKIVVDGTSLRQIYETHLIGERGLRRLVAEHLQGGDVKKIMRQEIVEHEIDFERDPAVRDIATPTSATRSSVSGVGSKAALDKLVQQASVGFGDNNPQAAYYKARVAYDAHEQSQRNDHRRAIDIGLGAIITILTVAVALLYLTRR